MKGQDIKGYVAIVGCGALMAVGITAGTYLCTKCINGAEALGEKIKQKKQSKKSIKTGTIEFKKG